MSLKKKQISAYIDPKLLDEFNKISESLAINKSKFIENQIKDFVTRNKEFRTSKSPIVVN